MVRRILIALGLILSAVSFVNAQDKSRFTLIVMDPLAAPLSCDCVKGYAQRDYKKLAAHLEKQLLQPIEVHFSESLTAGRAHLIIGKESVIRYQAKDNKLDVTPIASLTGKDGKTTMTGLFVIPKDDKALTLSDIKGYRILFGPSYADEKHKAALELLRIFEVPAPKELETCNSCSVGATKVLDLHKNGEKAVTVISSYAEPLLEGCGTIKKGDLRIIGETDPMPFVVAFVSDQVFPRDRALVQQALLSVGSDPALCTALETKSGFVRFDCGKKK
jgi:ABC-type phosphate/phosphonate transport system substrate-binding protein